MKETLQCPQRHTMEIVLLLMCPGLTPELIDNVGEAIKQVVGPNTLTGTGSSCWVVADGQAATWPRGW